MSPLQVEEWIEYETGARSEIRNGNPLMGHDLNADAIFKVFHL